MRDKKVILIDLDGVLNQYTGDFNSEIIPNIKQGAAEFLKTLSQQYEVKVFTTRNKIKTCKWLIDNKVDNYVSDITNVKDIAWLYIDDRCLKFEGDYSKLKNQIDKFKTWYK